MDEDHRTGVRERVLQLRLPQHRVERDQDHLPDGPDAVGAASLWAVGQDAVFNDRRIEYLTKDIPLRRLTEAADIAHSVTWIASERAARQVTGQVISVSGGYTMP